MHISFDGIVGVHPESLSVRSRRAEVLAANMASADTPGYKARDIDFDEVMQQAESGQPGGVQLARTDSGHIASDSSPFGGELYYRTPLQPDTGDGNTVDLQAERQRFMENSLRYQTSLEFLNGRIAMFRRAIQGDAS